MIVGSIIATVLIALVLCIATLRLRRLRVDEVGTLHRGLSRLNGGGSAHRRVRVAIYSVLLLASGQAAFQAWQVEASRAARAADAEVADLAGGQRMLGQRIGRLATLIDAGGVESVQHRQELRAALDRAMSEALRLEELLSALDGPAATAEAASLREALVAWKATRQRLWRQAQGLLDTLDSGAAGDIREARARVQAEAAPALHAVQRLIDELERGERSRHRSTAGAAKLWAAFAVLVLVGLAVAAAEPTARAVKSQYLRLAAQARDLERLALVAKLTTNAVIITDARQKIVWANEAFTRITGYSVHEAIGRSPAALLKNNRRDRGTVARIRESIDKGQGIRAQFLNRRKDGSDLWLDLDIQPLRDGHGVLTGFVDVASDITERRQAQAELRLAAIAFDSLEAIAITDASQVILKVNPAFTRITGYTSQEAVGQLTGQLLKSGIQDSAFYAELWRTLKEKRYWQGELWNRRKTGEIYPEWLSITAVMSDEGEVANYVAVFSDITQKKQADETIHSLAFYDPLTELPNRRLLRDRLEQALAAGARHHRTAAILFIDLDNFKELNDTKGHDVGDQLLIEVARRLQACVRANDTVARQGGDEFVVILTELNPLAEQAAIQAEVVAEKVRSAINQPFLLKGHEYHGTPSIGISLFSGHETTADDLLKRADTAMYEAKRSGRNAVRFFDPATHAAMEARIAMEADLRHALPEAQLALFYQMQVDAAGRTLGAEVLLRWLHPQRGLVPPAQFIPLAEETDLILPIGNWVLETACAQLRAWEQDANTRHLQLAVNVSARQFRQPDFVEQVRAALSKTGAHPSKLKLELTESLVLVNLSDTISKMQEIRDIGVRFSIDDFGTGQSSLAYLTQLPLDQIKIDQSFVRNLSVTRTDAVIVQAIIGMAKSLDLEVIAEGVETEEQRELLEGYGCSNFQGYLYGRPAPISEFEVSLRLRGGGPASPASFEAGRPAPRQFELELS